MSERQVENKTKKLSIKKPVMIFVGVIVGILLLFWIFEEMKYQSTDDAYVETTTVSVAPRVSGQIIEVYVKDNQSVKKGDIVAKIDPRDYEVRLAQADAAYQRELLNQKNAKANLNASNQIQMLSVIQIYMQQVQFLSKH